MIKRKVKTAVSIDEQLCDISEKFLQEKGIKNKSRYIEDLIRKDMEQRAKIQRENFKKTLTTIID
jgi:metal-responsive CopG/Arc/MetJ family transcriptional regulator